MILGKIIGKASTTEFKFLISGDAKKFDYLQVLDKNNNYVLGQIYEIDKDKQKTIAHCLVIGYRDKMLRQLRIPLDPGSEVLRADDNFVRDTLGLGEQKGYGYIGTLEGREKLKVFLDLNKAITRHVCVLAKSGYGKSYTVGVLLEELLERGIPLLIIDPHGEYSSLKYKNEKDKELVLKYGIKVKGYLNQIQEYSPNIEDNKEAKPLKLNGTNLDPGELLKILPAKLSNAQLGVMYAALLSSMLGLYS
jgi:hypothetical protein